MLGEYVASFPEATQLESHLELEEYFGQQVEVEEPGVTWDRF